MFKRMRIIGRTHNLALRSALCQFRGRWVNGFPVMWHTFVLTSFSFLTADPSDTTWILYIRKRMRKSVDESGPRLMHTILKYITCYNTFILLIQSDDNPLKLIRSRPHIIIIMIKLGTHIQNLNIPNPLTLITFQLHLHSYFSKFLVNYSFPRVTNFFQATYLGGDRNS